MNKEHVQKDQTPNVIPEALIIGTVTGLRMAVFHGIIPDLVGLIACAGCLVSFVIKFARYRKAS